MGTIKKRRNRVGEISYDAEVRRKGIRGLYRSFSRLTDARAWLQETGADLRRGKSMPTPESLRKTPSEAINRYLNEVTYSNPRCSREKHHHLGWFNERIGGRLLAEVTPAILSELRGEFLKGETRFKELRKPQTWNRYLTSLSCVLQLCARDWEWLDSNPVRKVRREHESPGRTRFLSEEERARLFEAAKNSTSKNLYPLILVALSTGMRRSEILTLRWSQVDLQSGCIILNKTKNKTSRRVPLQGAALDTLKENSCIRRIDSDLVFPAGKTASPGRCFSLDKFWYATLEKAEIKDFRFHDLRHSAASYLAMSGASLLEIAEVLGHKTLQMVKRYSHLSESHTSKVVEKMNKQFFG